MVRLSIHRNQTAHWHGVKGRRLALHIGQRKRHAIVTFVIENTKEQPVTVVVERFERRQPMQVYACICAGGLIKVGLTYENFFVVIAKEHVKDDIRQLLDENTQLA